MSASLFDTADNPPVPFHSPFSLAGSDENGGITLKTRGRTVARPLHSTPVDGFSIDLQPFWIGCRMLGLKSVGPQQVELASLLLAEDAEAAPAVDEVVVCWPRRATKTTTIWAVLLGLCATRPDYRVVTTAQTYVKARERFLEVARAIAPRNIGAFRILKGAAAEAIEWTNGSRLWVVTPEGGAFRGDGADRILFDEAQEHSPAKTADLLGGALALMDTRFDEDADLTDPDARPDGQIIVTGTAGESRDGMLWDYLERGRAGGEVAIVEYAVPDSIPVAFPADSDEGRAGIDAGWFVEKTGRFVLNEPAILAAHPGIGTMTTLGVIRGRFDALGLPQFTREYGGQWPHSINTRAIDPGEWAAGRVTTAPARPARYAIGYDVAPDQSTAAIGAAWRDAEGRAWFEVIDHRAGDAWLPRAAYDLTREHPDVKVAYDNIGPNQAIADRLNREARPRPRLHALGTRDITAAASTVLSELAAGTLAHVADPALDNAAEIATRRTIGDGSWAWGRVKSGDIAALVACSNALKVYDSDPRNRNNAGGRRRGFRTQASTR